MASVGNRTKNPKLLIGCINTCCAVLHRDMTVLHSVASCCTCVAPCCTCVEPYCICIAPLLHLVAPVLHLCCRVGYARAKSAVKPWFCSVFWRCGLGHQVAGSAVHFQFDPISIEFQVSSISLTRAARTGSASPSNSLDLVIENKSGIPKGRIIRFILSGI